MCLHSINSNVLCSSRWALWPRLSIKETSPKLVLLQIQISLLHGFVAATWVTVALLLHCKNGSWKPADFVESCRECSFLAAWEAFVKRVYRATQHGIVGIQCATQHVDSLSIASTLCMLQFDTWMQRVPVNSTNQVQLSCSTFLMWKQIQTREVEFWNTASDADSVHSHHKDSPDYDMSAKRVPSHEIPCSGPPMCNYRFRINLVVHVKVQIGVSDLEGSMLPVHYRGCRTSTGLEKTITSLWPVIKLCS